MNNTNLLNTNFFRGCPRDHEDGDIAALEEQTVMRPGVHSSNNTNSQDRAPRDGLGTLLLCETITEPENQPEHNSEIGNQLENNSNIPQENNTGLQNLTKQIDKLNSKTQKIWKGIGKKQGIRTAALNMNGRRDEKKKDKWPMLTSLAKSQGIAILGLQETHLNVEETEKLNDRF